jgi:hypothetical protein
MDFGMMTGFIVEIVIIPFYIGLIPFEPRFCPKSNKDFGSKIFEQSFVSQPGHTLIHNAFPIVIVPT